MAGCERQIMEQKENVIRISVRNLVEFILRAGDIDRRHQGPAKTEAMLLGARLHRKLQKAEGPSYRAEVPLNYSVRDEEIELLVEGRADGVITGTDPLTGETSVTVDEIKGIYQDPRKLSGPVPVHEAQAMCYAFILAEQGDLSAVTVRLTYIHMESEEIRRFSSEKSREELKEWFEGIIHEYLKWARWIYHHALRRNESVKNLEFPFPYRPGQRELAVYIYRTQERKKRIFVQAPTGIGKTLAVLFPSVKALAGHHGSRIFYLTAKTVTATAAEEGLQILQNSGLHLHSVTITAREKLCILEKPACSPESCPRAEGHFDRVNEALFDLLCHESSITREVLLDYAERYRLCPYELALDITDFCDLVICDYNYAFDPEVKLRRFFSPESGGDSLLLIDEAHNLPGRAREMYSASLKKEDILAAKRAAGGQSKALSRRLHAVNKAFLALKKETVQGFRLIGEEEHKDLLSALWLFFGEASDFLEQAREFEGKEDFLQVYFSVRHYLQMAELADGEYRVYAERLSGDSFLIRELCVNPSRLLSGCLEAAGSAVFFSATLLPLAYYRELIVNDPEDYAVYVPSPFPRENRRILIVSDVTSRYSRRGEEEYKKISSCIRDCVLARKGNYMVFFPSYRFLHEVMSLLPENPGFEVIVQDSSLKEEERRAFLREFERERAGSLAAFCVMGGMFGEGIDLPGDRLIGAIIVGTGLPQVSTEQEILKNAFTENGHDGFSFAFQYPGITKVLQAAGRVIRTPEDRGVILLLDDRFRRKEIKSLFPREWDDVRSIRSQEIGKELSEFWNSFT